jgi:hypothetical protein
MSCTTHPDAPRTPPKVAAVIINYSNQRGQATRYEDVYCLPCAQAWLNRRSTATHLQVQSRHAFAGRPRSGP